LQESEKAFTQAMEAMCFMVNITYEAYRRNGQNVFNVSVLDGVKNQCQLMCYVKIGQTKISRQFCILYVQ